MAGKMQRLSESVVIRSLRSFRDTYLTNSRGEVSADGAAGGAPGGEEEQPGLVDSLPVRQITPQTIRKYMSV